VASGVLVALMVLGIALFRHKPAGRAH
jgi:hypothetical protein